MFGESNVGGRSGTTEGQKTGRVHFGTHEGAGSPRSQTVTDTPENKPQQVQGTAKSTTMAPEGPLSHMASLPSSKPEAVNKHAGNMPLKMSKGKPGPAEPGRNQPPA